MLAAALMAPAIAIFFSYLLKDSSLRHPVLLIIVVLTGAIGGRVVFEMYATSKKVGWLKPLFALTSIFIYALFVLAGIIIARLGPFN